MVSPTLPGYPYHVSIDETSMLIRAFLLINKYPSITLGTIAQKPATPHERRNLNI